MRHWTLANECVFKARCLFPSVSLFWRKMLPSNLIQKPFSLFTEREVRPLASIKTPEGELSSFYDVRFLEDSKPWMKNPNSIMNMGGKPLSDCGWFYMLVLYGIYSTITKY